MWKLIVGKPWAQAALFALGVAFGGSGAWWAQGQRLAATQARFDVFVSTVAAEGASAKKLAEAKADEAKRIKGNSDYEYQITLASLHADNKRLRDARAGSRVVPAAPAGSRSPVIACFDRAELEQALQRFDSGIAGLFDEGDTDAIGLNVARSWAARIRAGMSPDSRASDLP